MDKLTKEQVKGIIRHVLTFLGGLLILKGYADESLITEIIGGVTTLVGSVWSVFEKKSRKDLEE